MATTYHVSPRHDQKRFCWAFHSEDQTQLSPGQAAAKETKLIFCKFPKTPGKAHTLVCEMILRIL